MPDVEVLFRREDQPLGVRYLYDVTFGFVGNPPAGTDGSENYAELSGSFSKITGLREEIERVAWRDGTEPFRARHGPGTISGGIATFEKGVVRAPLTLIRWFTAVRFLSKSMEHRAVINDVNEVIRPILIDGVDAGNTLAGEPQIPLGDDFGLFANVSINIGSCEPEPGSNVEADVDGSFFGARRIALFKCWPVAYQISDLDAKASEVALESLSVSFDELRTGRAIEGPDPRTRGR